MRYKIFLIAVFTIGVAIGLAMGFRLASRRLVPKYVPAKRKVVAPVVEKKAVELPLITKRYAHPKVAIVMDDFGYNMNNLEDVFNIKKSITISVLPNLRYSNEIAKSARANGYEVILHLPLEPHREDVREEVDTINSTMNEEAVAARLEAAIDSVPGLKGASNHMGSKSTEDRGLMTMIFKGLKKQRRLYFLDSLTSDKSICEETARAVGIRYAKRDIFLDNSNSVDYIRNQILSLRAFAFKRGRAIAVCHDRRNTVKVLSEMMPKLAGDGIRFVYLSEMVK